MSKFGGRQAVVLRHLSLDMTVKGESRNKTEKIAESQSGVDRYKGFLFLGSDEGRSVERLKSGEADDYDGREEFPLEAFFDLPGDAAEEADIESLSIYKNWLWLVSSHALTRTKLQGSVEKFANLEFHSRRYILCRLPLVVGEDGVPTPVRSDGERKAQCVPLSAEGSALTAAMAQDPHLQRSLAIPDK